MWGDLNSWGVSLSAAVVFGSLLFKTDTVEKVNWQTGQGKWFTITRFFIHLDVPYHQI